MISKGSCFTITLVFLVAVSMLAGSTSEDIPRFHEVRSGIFRGGQPSRAGFIKLQQLGIRTVINLTEESVEKEQVESLGMKFVHIPIAAPWVVEPWKMIDYTDVQNFFSVTRNPANQPIFVHCQRGADRTGVMIGLYRISFENWTPEKAYSEARDIGLRWWYVGYKRQFFEFRPVPDKLPARR